MGLIAFLPALIVIILLLLKKSAIISILISAATGIGVAVIYQGKSLAYVLTCFWSGVKSDTGMELVDTLLSRGGVTSLFSSASLYLITFGLIGILVFRFFCLSFCGKPHETALQENECKRFRFNQKSGLLCYPFRAVDSMEHERCHCFGSFGGILFPICALLFPGICHAGSVNRQLSVI